MPRQRTLVRGGECGDSGLRKTSDRSGSARQADLHIVNMLKERSCSSRQAPRKPPEAAANTPAPRRQPVSEEIHRDRSSRHSPVPEPEFAAQPGDSRADGRTQIPARPLRSGPAHAPRDMASAACRWFPPESWEALPNPRFASAYRLIQIIAGLPARPRQEFGLPVRNRPRKVRL